MDVAYVQAAAGTWEPAALMSSTQQAHKPDAAVDMAGPADRSAGANPGGRVADLHQILSGGGLNYRETRYAVAGPWEPAVTASAQQARKGDVAAVVDSIDQFAKRNLNGRLANAYQIMSDENPSYRQMMYADMQMKAAEHWTSLISNICSSFSSACRTLYEKAAG